MIDFLQGVLVIASFFGIVYAPFHFLERFASSEAKAKVRSAIRVELSGVDFKPLSTLLDTVFGPRHFTWRCAAMSCALSLLFTALSLGVFITYMVDLPDYLERRQAHANDLQQAIDKAIPAVINLSDILIPELEKDKTPEGQRTLQDMKERRAQLEGMKESSYPTLPSVLLWMLASVAISMNFLCDYLALGKTRLILRRIVKAESRIAIAAYLVLDLLLAFVIWSASVAVFLMINTETFLNWSKEEPTLVAAVGVVSLWTTIATSIWIYAFLLGGTLTRYLRRLVRLLLKGTTRLIDPYDHPFKVIGIVGSIAMVTLTVITAFAFS